MTYEFRYEFMHMKNIVKIYMKSGVPRLQKADADVSYLLQIHAGGFPAASAHPHRSNYETIGTKVTESPPLRLPLDGPK